MLSTNTYSVFGTCSEHVRSECVQRTFKTRALSCLGKLRPYHPTRITHGNSAERILLGGRLSARACHGCRPRPACTARARHHSTYQRTLQMHMVSYRILHSFDRCPRIHAPSTPRSINGTSLKCGLSAGLLSCSVLDLVELMVLGYLLLTRGHLKWGLGENGGLL